jgi:hypothetical protein
MYYLILKKCFVTGEETSRGTVLPGTFFAGKILNRYNYRFYGPNRKKIQEQLKEKRAQGAGEEKENEGEKKKKVRRLPEVYCVNKKKFWSEASSSEMAATLEIVAGGDNERTHRIIQCKLR